MSEQAVLEKNTEQQIASIEEKNIPVNVESKTAKPVKQKNYGIEMLRILSMFFIVILHVINFGGASYYYSGIYFPITEEIIVHYKAMNIMLAFCMCAVNCYALISGYVSCKSKFKPSKLLSLWVTVVAINAALYVAAYLYNPEWAAAYDIKRIFYPLTNDQYWYFTCYAGLLVLMPALNAAVNNIPKKTYGYMLIGMFVFFSFLPIYSGKDLFKTSSGYSMMWLILLYFTGAYFKLHFNPKKKIPLFKTACVAVYIICALAMSFIRFREETKLMGDGAGFTLYAYDYQYHSVYVVLCSLALFLLFININIKNKVLGKIIGFVSSTTFGIYLIHLNYIVVDRVITGRFMDIALKKPAGMVLGTLAVGVVIFVICAVLEKVRQLLFKLLFIDKLIALVDRIKLPEKKSKE